MRGAGESRAEVLAQVAAEERGDSITAVLAHVGELVRQEARGVRRVGEEVRSEGREEDAPPENDRVGAEISCSSRDDERRRQLQSGITPPNARGVQP